MVSCTVSRVHDRGVSHWSLAHSQQGHLLEVTVICFFLGRLRDGAEMSVWLRHYLYLFVATKFVTSDLLFSFYVRAQDFIMHAAVSVVDLKGLTAGLAYSHPSFTSCSSFHAAENKLDLTCILGISFVVPNMD